MIGQFSSKVTQILAFSRNEAVRLSCQAVGPEHLLLALMRLKDGDMPRFFKSLKLDVDALKTELEDRVRNDSIYVPAYSDEIQLTEAASNILRLSVLEARLQHTNIVDEHHILLAMLHDQVNNGAKLVLASHDISYDSALGTWNQLVTVNDQMQLADDDEDVFEDNNNGGKNTTTATQEQKGGKSKTPALDKFSFDLTKAAREGKLDPVVGREKEIARVIEILGRRKKNNPILIGEPGVGKSSIVEGLAQMIADKKTSPIFFDKRIVNLDMTGIVAGTKYRGQFEERIKVIINELEQNPDIIVFIDEIHTIIGAGSASGTMDAANIMKPALARGTIQCIGATTIKEYRNSIEKDGALERRFQKVMVEQTTEDQTLEILHNIKDRYEDHHSVKYTDEALAACVKYTKRYVTERQFPDKAIDALDEAGSKVHLTSSKVPQNITDKEKELAEIKTKKSTAVRNQNFELAAAYRDEEAKVEDELDRLNKEWQSGAMKILQTVEEKDIANVISTMTGVPVQQMADEEGIRLKGMAKALESEVIAQEKAIEKVVKAIQRNRLGLKDPNKPIGVFMFLGPTGVGKTHLAKRLAEFMFGSTDALIRIDMSEYSESFNVSRLVGAPPGYVGYEEGGQLTERVRSHPYSIVLLDEIEKAHSNVFNMLLQVLDEGRLTDGNGRMTDFRNTVIIMTSNAGTRQLKEFAHGVGFNATNLSGDLNDKDKEHARSVIQKALSKQFAPEFLNRLDEIITFDQLDKSAIRKIVDIELAVLLKRIEAIGYKLDISDEAKDFVASKGYDIQFGARPLKRAIQTYIEDELSDLIINGDTHKGDEIEVSKGEDCKLTLSVKR